MRKLFTLAYLLCIISVIPVSAQERVNVTGRIMAGDTGQPLIGATVTEAGTSNGVSTSVDGAYAIKAAAGSTLQFSFMGYEKQEVRVDVANMDPETKNIVINITMQNEATGIEDVVVIAYGVRKKGTVAGSVATISAEKLNDVPAASFDQALQGKSPGLTVLNGSGEPGAAAVLKVRGVNSINSGTTPLIIVDGISVSSTYFSSLNPNDIESVNVLKDASSTSIYGARAANGVILVTTKRGRMNEKGRVTFRTQLGFSDLAYGKWNLMNTQERIQYEKEIGLDAGKNYEVLAKTNVNWLKEIFNSSAPLRSYEVNTSGGSQNINYYVSGGYYGQEGIAPNSDYERYSVRTNMEARVAKWLKVGTNSTFSYEYMENAVAGGAYYLNTPISASRFMLPYVSPYNKDGSLASVEDGSWLTVGQNPLEWSKYNHDTGKRYKLLSAIYAEVSPVQGLTLKTNAGIDYTSQNSKSSSSPAYASNNYQGALRKSNETSFNLSLTNTATYIFDLNREHFFNILLGHEMINDQYDSFSIDTRGQNNSQMMTLSTATTVPSWGDSKSGASYMSFFARAEYNYQGKYYADLSVRRDGSSKFGRDNRWANFWSVGLMWDFRKENFMQKYKWLTNAQLSASIGTSGNSSIPNYIHEALVGGGPSYLDIAGLAPVTRGNTKLTWETLRTANIGLKLGFLHRINLTVEYYDKKTTDMLMQVPVSMTSGYSMEWSNIGVMQNRGVELDLSVDVIRNKNFFWNINANASYNKNKIKELYQNRDEYELSNAGMMLKVGHPYGEFYMNRFAGVNPVNGDALWYTKDGKLTNEYSEDDKVFVGKSWHAPWQGGFGTSLQYKGISLMANFSWVAKRWMINNDRVIEESNGTFMSYNQSKRLLNRWKNPGDITDVPRHGVVSRSDTRFLEDASFLRLKNLTLSYSLPKALLEKTKFFESVRVFGQAQNLFTWTKFTGLDPEGYNNVYRAAYPLSRQFTFGLEVTF